MAGVGSYICLISCYQVVASWRKLFFLAYGIYSLITPGQACLKPVSIGKNTGSKVSFPEEDCWDIPSSSARSGVGEFPKEKAERTDCRGGAGPQTSRASHAPLWRVLSWTALSPFSISYLRKSESHRQAPLWRVLSANCSTTQLSLCSTFLQFDYLCVVALLCWSNLKPSYICTGHPTSVDSNLFAVESVVKCILC